MGVPRGALFICRRSIIGKTLGCGPGEERFESFRRYQKDLLALWYMGITLDCLSG